MADKVPVLQLKGKKSTVLSRLIQAILDLCYPPHCLLCATPLSGPGNSGCCPTCLPQLALLHRPVCECCGIPFPWQGNEHNHLCGRCLQKQPHFSKARALFPYNQAMAQLIHRFKFHGDKSALASLALLARESSLLAELQEPELIVPVPLHRRRLQERCFNQASILAAALFPTERQQICHPLARLRATTPQKGLSGRERRRNVVGAFTVTEQTMVFGKRILLIDDVFTTGSTLDACAAALKQAGSGEIQALTLAVALPTIQGAATATPTTPAR